MAQPVLHQLNLLSDDFEGLTAFYRLLGIKFSQPILDTRGDPFHANCAVSAGLVVEVDAPRFARMWNEGWRDEEQLAGRVVLGFRVADRAAVDQAYASIIKAGFRGLQPPYDAFWGARYAIVEDPAGNAVGMMSPVDEAMRSAPPPI